MNSCGGTYGHLVIKHISHKVHESTTNGNFLLSTYELQRKNYEKEFNYLMKGHSYYFESQKEKFTNVIEYWLKASSEVKKLVNLNKSNMNIKNKKRLTSLKGNNY